MILRERGLAMLSRGLGSTSLLLFLFPTERDGKRARPWLQLRHLFATPAQLLRCSPHSSSSCYRCPQRAHWNTRRAATGSHLALLCSETGEARSNCTLAYQTTLQQNHAFPWQSTEFCDNLEKIQYCACWGADPTGPWVKQMAIYFSEALPCASCGLHQFGGVHISKAILQL